MILNSALSDFSHAGNERYLLSCILKNSNLIYEAEAVVDSTDFLTTANRNIFSILKHLARQGKEFDIPSIVNEAIALGINNDIGDLGYVNQVYDTNTSPGNFQSYLKAVKENSIKKKLFEALKDAEGLVSENSQYSEQSKSSDELLSAVHNSILNISLESKHMEDAKELGDGIDGYLEEVQKYKTKILGIPTGFQQLDDSINGLRPGTLTVVAARPKRGKSMLLQNWANHIVYKEKEPLLYVDTEMIFNEVRSRELACISGVEEREIINGLFADDPDKVKKVEEAREIMRHGQFYHKYFPGFSVERVANLARKYKIRHNIKALFFDYIKLPETASLRDAKEYQHLGFFATALKDLAGELNIPVVTAIQISRAGVDRDIVTTAMIADSDRIVRYANTILALTRKTDDEIDVDGHDKGNTRLQILDTRSGQNDDWDGLHLWLIPKIARIWPTGETYKLSELLPKSKRGQAIKKEEE